MELDKIRNLSDGELGVEGHKAAEQLFRLRFQLKLGQTDVVKKVRVLRKDIARIKTVERERELGLHGEQHKLESTTAEGGKATKKAASRKTTAKKTAAKKATGSKGGAKKTAAKKSTKKTGKKGAR
jgi:large subunit ribosomal protein L29